MVFVPDAFGTGGGGANLGYLDRATTGSAINDSRNFLYNDVGAFQWN
jgi:hypothetical protein